MIPFVYPDLASPSTCDSVLRTVGVLDLVGA